MLMRFIGAELNLPCIISIFISDMTPVRRLNDVTLLENKAPTNIIQLGNELVCEIQHIVIRVTHKPALIY